MDNPTRERFEQYLKSDRNNPYLLAALIESALGRGDAEQAGALAAQALAAHPDAARFRYLEVAAACMTMAPEEAERSLGEFVAKEGAHADASIALALRYIQRGAYQDAYDLLAGFADGDPTPSAAILLQARCLHQLGHAARASELMHSYLERAPDDSDACGLAALLALDLGNAAQAELLGQRALRLDAGNLAALVSLGTVNGARNNWDEGRKYYERAFALAPGDGRVQLGLGVLELVAGRPDDGCTLLNRAVETMPGHPGAWVALGWAEFFCHRRSEARAAFERAAALSRSFAEAYGGLAALDVTEGAVVEAERHVKRALRLDPACRSALFAQGLLSGTVHDPQSVRAFIQQYFSSLAPVLAGDGADDNQGESDVTDPGV